MKHFMGNRASISGRENFRTTFRLGSEETAKGMERGDPPEPLAVSGVTYKYLVREVRSGWWLIDSECWSSGSE